MHLEATWLCIGSTFFILLRERVRRPEVGWIKTENFHREGLGRGHPKIKVKRATSFRVFASAAGGEEPKRFAERWNLFVFHFFRKKREASRRALYPEKNAWGIGGIRQKGLIIRLMYGERGREKVNSSVGFLFDIISVSFNFSCKIGTQSKKKCIKSRIER